MLCEVRGVSYYGRSLLSGSSVLLSHKSALVPPSEAAQLCTAAAASR